MSASHAFDLDAEEMPPLTPDDPFPVRNYIATMASELSLMARSVGEHELAETLARAARQAGA
ncbi:MAG: hypothetical protein ACK4Z5_07550 [Brevundimonas sp.]